MEPFSDQKFEKRLHNLKDTQESIQSLSGWCLQYKSHAPSIVKHWLKAVKKAKVPQRLVLFYLANDILQHSRRKHISSFLINWLNAFRDAVPLVRDEKVKKQVLRMLTIWDERSVYTSDEINELKALLEETEKSETPVDYDPTLLYQKLQDFKKIEEETDLRQKMLNEAPINVSFDSETIRSVLKEKGQSYAVLNELNDSINCMESVVDALSTEVGKRIALIALLQQANNFYNHQRNEAKVVCTAYKSFAHRVKQVKQEIEKKINTLSDLQSIASPPPLPPAEDSLESRLNNINNLFGNRLPPPDVSQFLQNEITEIEIPKAEAPRSEVPPFPPAPPGLPFLPSLLPSLPANILSMLSTVMGGGAPPPPISTESNSYQMEPPNQADMYPTEASSHGMYSSEADHSNMPEHGSYETQDSNSQPYAETYGGDELYNPYDTNLDFSEEMGELDFLDNDIDMRQKEKSTSRRDNINTSNLICLTSRGDDSPQRLLKSLDLPALSSLRQKLKTALKKETGEELGAMDMELSDGEDEDELSQNVSSEPSLPPSDMGDFNYRKDVDFRLSQVTQHDRDMRPPDLDFRNQLHGPPYARGFDFHQTPDTDFRHQPPPDFSRPPDFDLRERQNVELPVGVPPSTDRDFRKPADADFRSGQTLDIDFRQRPKTDFMQHTDFHRPPPEHPMRKPFDTEFERVQAFNRSKQPDLDFWQHNNENFGRQISDNFSQSPPDLLKVSSTGSDRTGAGVHSKGEAYENSLGMQESHDSNLPDSAESVGSNQTQQSDSKVSNLPFQADTGAQKAELHEESSALSLQTEVGPSPQRLGGARYKPDSDSGPRTPGRFDNRGPHMTGPRFDHSPSHHFSPRNRFDTPPRNNFGSMSSPRVPGPGQDFRPRFQRGGPVWQANGPPRLDGPPGLLDMNISQMHHQDSSENYLDNPFGDYSGPGGDSVLGRRGPLFSEFHHPQRVAPPHAFRSPRGFNQFGPRFRGGPRF